MNEPLLHPTSKVLLEAIKAKLPQSLLLTGRKGVGLGTIALWLADKHLLRILTPTNTKNEPDPGGTISIEAIRHLYEQTKGKSSTYQVVIIDNADTMSRSAQSAFLKLLEEPSLHIHFILTSHTPTGLLPTIHSRVQTYQIAPITSEQSEAYIQELGVHDSTKQKQLLFLAQGLPSELRRLAQDDSYFTDQARIVNDARSLIQNDTYERLLLIQKYRNDRQAALQLIDSALHLLQRGLALKPQISIVQQLQHLLIVRENIAANQSISLQLGLFVL